MINKKQAFLILTLVTVVATAIRALVVYNWQGLSFDEIISVSVAQKPLADMWQYLKWEMHPPLHFIYLHYWLKLFGSSDIAARLSSVFLCALSIIATYFLSKEIFQKRLAGIYGAVLTSLIYATFFWSLIARMYVLFFLLSILSFYLLFKTINSRGRAQIIYGTFYGLVTLLALYTHLTVLSIPFIQIAYLGFLYFKKLIDKNLFKKIIWLNVAVLIFYLPWFISFFINRLSSLGTNAWYMFTQADKIFFLSIPATLLVGNSDSQVISLFVSLAFIVILFIAIFQVNFIDKNSLQLNIRADHITLLALLIIYVPMAVLFMLDLNTLRFYMLSALGLIILITQAMLNIANKKYLLLAQVFALAMLLIPLANLANMQNFAWPEIAEFIEEREQAGDNIISAYSANLLTLQYYYQGQLPIDTFVDPDIKAEAADDLEMVMRTNSIIYVNDENIHDFKKLIDEEDRIFFLFTKQMFGNSYTYFTDWFIEQGWQKIDGLDNYNFSAPSIWLLEKSKT